MIINSSLLDIEGTLDSGNEAIRQNIKKWIKDNFRVVGLKISDIPNEEGKYKVSALDVDVTNKNITSLTNGMFIWTIVRGYFTCSYCPSLKTLEGAPKEVGCNFYCSNCQSLTSLKGAPKLINGNFSCSNCDNLISLKDAPNYVTVFCCNNCKSLKSIYLPNASKIIHLIK